MKIDTIFVGYLYALHYDGEADNELDRLLDEWFDVNKLYQFAIINKIPNEEQFVKERLNDAEQFDDAIKEIEDYNDKLNLFFQPLDDNETHAGILSLQKAKFKKNILRFYAIRIDDNLFLITGGAIKITDRMKQHPDTRKELRKINYTKSWLQNKGIFDNDSFYEFIKEQND